MGRALLVACIIRIFFSLSLVTGSGRNGNEADAGAASQAFARWLREFAHRYAPAVELLYLRDT